MLKLQHRKYPLRCVAFSADGQLLAACGAGGTVQVWDLGSNGDGDSPSQHAGWVNAVAISADGTRAVSGIS